MKMFLFSMILPPDYLNETIFFPLPAPKSATNQAMSESHLTNANACPSVVTPSLITATCHLLHNLVILFPQETLDSLKKHSILYSLIW